METTLREIVLAIPALSKLAAAPLRLRSAYRLQKRIFSPSSGRRFYPHTAKRTAAESIIFRQSRSRKLSPSWKNCWIWQSPRRVNGSPCR